MVLGYILLPTMLFAFISLMTITLDSIFYGQIDPTKSTIAEVCQLNSSNPVNSIYCIIAQNASSTAPNNITGCALSSGQMFSNITQIQPTGVIGSILFGSTVYVYNGQFIQGILTPLLQMLLFIVLFYYLSESVLNTFEDLLTIFGITSTGNNTYRGLRNTMQSSAKVSLQAFKLGGSALKSGISKLNNLRNLK
jgi:type IV secretory pathway VirB6-like protein